MLWDADDIGVSDDMYRWVALREDRETRKHKELEDLGEEELKLRSAAPSRKEIKKEVSNRELALVRERKELRKKHSILSSSQKKI